MEKEFVSYEQALALKELGFDKQSLLRLPIKSQVFRWFREKYNQNSFIELVYQDGIKYDYVLYADKDEEECENFGDGPFDTYDEAEDACIDKLIEIVKQQTNDKD